jgi:hypothetical protein
MEKHSISIFRAEDDSVSNETEVVGNRSEQFPVTTVSKQLFHVALCDFQFKRLIFSIKT